MQTFDWVGVLSPTVSALLGGLAVHWLNRRKLSSDALASESATNEHLYNALVRARTEKMEADRVIEQLHLKIAHLQSEIDRLPMVYVRDHLRELNGLAKFFDNLDDPIVASVSDDGGKLIYANPAFCVSLGRPQQEIMELGWKTLVHPDDLARSSSVEAYASFDAVRGFVNRYRHSNGSWVALRWTCGAYVGRMTLCRVKVEGIISS